MRLAHPSFAPLNSKIQMIFFFHIQKNIKHLDLASFFVCDFLFFCASEREEYRGQVLWIPSDKNNIVFGVNAASLIYGTLDSCNCAHPLTVRFVFLKWSARMVELTSDLSNTCRMNHVFHLFRLNESRNVDQRQPTNSTKKTIMVGKESTWLSPLRGQARPPPSAFGTLLHPCRKDYWNMQKPLQPSICNRWLFVVLSILLACEGNANTHGEPKCPRCLLLKLQTVCVPRLKKPTKGFSLKSSGEHAIRLVSRKCSGPSASSRQLSFFSLHQQLDCAPAAPHRWPNRSKQYCRCW